jgi:hypothetical protein
MARVLDHDLERFSSLDEFLDELDWFLSRFQLRLFIPGEWERMPDDDKQMVFLCFNDSGDPTLICPGLPDKARQLDRVLRCFRPVLLRAKSLWAWTVPVEPC